MGLNGLLTGIVLAGGKSKRLGKGRSKPLIQVGGKLLLARVVDTLKPICDELILVVKPNQEGDIPDLGIALGTHVVTDTNPFSGPLAGLHAGLSTSVTPLSFVVGADHPFLSRKLIETMINMSISTGTKQTATSIVPRHGGYLYPLHSIYTKIGWSDFIIENLSQGISSISQVIKNAINSEYPPVQLITDEEMELIDPMFMSLMDINNQESLMKCRKIADHKKLYGQPRRNK